jgi:hypothetical protein
VPSPRQSRNFALNPREGLKIKAFKGAATGSAASDKELIRLSGYVSTFPLPLGLFSTPRLTERLNELSPICS